MSHESEEISTYLVPFMMDGDRLEITLGPSEGVRENAYYNFSVVAGSEIGTVSSESRDCCKLIISYSNFIVYTRLLLVN